MLQTKLYGPYVLTDLINPRRTVLVPPCMAKVLYMARIVGPVLISHFIVGQPRTPTPRTGARSRAGTPVTRAARSTMLYTVPTGVSLTRAYTTRHHGNLAILHTPVKATSALITKDTIHLGYSIMDFPSRQGSGWIFPLQSTMSYTLPYFLLSLLIMAEYNGRWSQFHVLYVLMEKLVESLM